MCTSTTVLRPAATERVHYFSRQLITADDMVAEQEYFRQKMRRHNRYLHGWGVVCGCTVVPPSTPVVGHPWQVVVCPGYIITPQGDEILIGEPVNFDLAGDSRQPQNPCECPSPCPPVGASGAVTDPLTVYLAVCYTECETRPVRVHPVGCACDETSCEYSRIRDSFEVQRLALLPSSYEQSPPTATLCDFINNQVVPDCPSCPSDPWVVIAAITLPASSSDKVTASNIDNFKFRRQILSTAILQQQIVDCCCGGADLQIQQNFEVTPIAGSNLSGLKLTITVKNNGPRAADNVTVAADIPILGQLIGEININPQLPLKQSPNGLQADLGTLNNGDTVSLLCSFDPIPGGITGIPNPTLKSTATVQSSTPDPNMANNSTVVQGAIRNAG
jgi:uncharacterized protein DUF11